MTFKEARTKAGLTQQQVADLFEIPKRTIENWDEGKRNPPKYVERLIFRELANLGVKTFRILWEDVEGNTHDDCIQALTPEQGMEILGISRKELLEVAVVIECY